MQNRRRILPVVIGLVIIAGAIIIRQVFFAGGGALSDLSRNVATEQDDAQLLAVYVSPDGKLAAVDVNDSPDDSLRMVDASSGKAKWRKVERDIVFNDDYVIGFTSDSSSFIVSGKIDDKVVIWYLDANNGDVTDDIALNAGETTLTANDTYYVVNNGGLLAIYNRTSKDIYFSNDFGKKAEFARFTSDGTHLLTAHSNPAIKGYDFYLIDLANPQVGSEPTFNAENLAAIDKSSPLISSDGKFLAFAIINGRGIFLINLETHQAVFNRFGDQLTSERVGTVRFDPLYGFLKNNSIFAYLTNEGILYAVNVSSGEITEQIDLGLGDQPRRLSISADGSTMAVLHHDSLYVWH